MNKTTRFDAHEENVRTTTTTKKVGRDFENLNERFIKATATNLAVAAEPWTRFDGHPRRITVDGQDAILF